MLRSGTYERNLMMPSWPLMPKVNPDVKSDKPAVQCLRWEFNHIAHLLKSFISLFVQIHSIYHVCYMVHTVCIHIYFVDKEAV